MTACDGGEDFPRDDSSLKIAVRATSSLDPAFLRDATGILVARQIFEPLLSFDSNTSRVVPALASSFEVHDGGSRFVFRLRDSKFHNGRAVTAGDLVYSLNRLASKPINSEASFLLDSVAGFNEVNVTGTAAALQGLRELDALTLEITLSAPWFDFPFVLTHPSTAPVPREAVEAGAEAFSKNPVGNGPYQMFTQMTESGDIFLKRFEGYHRKAKIASVEMLAYEEPEVAWRDLEAGTIDVAEIPPGKTGEGRSKYGSRGLTPVAAGLYVGFNLSNPKFADVKLRRAISLAIDRAAISRFI
ncbi:MAG: ABC transporter substrate-binding protein [Acidimicrobiia bacterium]